MSNTTCNFALDGELVPIKNIKISLSMPLPDKEQSGNTSTTTTSPQGIKAKEIKVTGLIPFTEPDKLKKIYQLASATGKVGEKKIYRIASYLTRGVHLRAAAFTGSVDANEDDGLQAWSISFSLREYVSVPQAKQARDKEKPVPPLEALKIKIHNALGVYAG